MSLWDVGEVIPVGSLRPIWTTHKTLGGHIPEHPSCGGFMPTTETTLILALGNQRAAIRSLTSDARLDNETNCKSGYLPMTSFRQIEANRRNARKSTRPITEEGKQRSRCTAVHHGLMAETVIGALENAEDYKAFQCCAVSSISTTSVPRNRHHVFEASRSDFIWPA
jgi:hypothetical protein